MSLQPIPILGFDNQGGLKTNKKPYLLSERSFQQLFNAFVYRDRVTKREGLLLVGRLQRIFQNYTLGPSLASPWSFNLLTVSGYIDAATQANPGKITTTYPHGLTSGDNVSIAQVVGMTQLNGNTYTITVVDPTNFTIGVDTTGFTTYVSGGVWFSNRSLSATEPFAELTPGSVTIVVGVVTFTDQGNGTLTSITPGNSGTINYVTGAVVLTTTQAPGSATTLALSYSTGLPSMTVAQRELALINDEQTIFFDTKYAYIFNGTNFQEFLPGTTWNGSNSDFYWTANVRGALPQDRLFFVTNFFNDPGSPMRYTDGSTWTDFSPALASDDEVTENTGSIVNNGTTYSGQLQNIPLPGSVTITVAGIVFTDSTGSGVLTGNPNTNTGTISYTTGAFTLNFSPTINFTGTITASDAPTANTQFTSANHHLTTGAQLIISGTTGTTEVNGKTFTITVVDANNFTIGFTTTHAYTGGGTWTLTDNSTTVFATYEYADTILWSARILIPYFGRLIALNTWEGSTQTSAANIYNRCRFSQVGNPVQSDAWRNDIFGKGGYLDAPTNEQIIGCTFLNNTLIVFFEKTTWQLRYVGEYGLPFIWERIASDFGSESTFSTVLFNNGILAVGDRAIITANSNVVERIDLDIPDTVFSFQNANNGVKRVQGVRDYLRELVFWSYPDSNSEAAPGVTTIYPNRVLVFNYRNNTWAMFRDNVTCFGTLQDDDSVTWDNLDVFWEDNDVFWDDASTQSRFPFVVSGNQEGFIHKYGYTTQDEASLSITGVSYSTGNLSVTINNHNLSNGEIIYITGLNFVDPMTLQPITTTLNNKIYQVQVTDINTLKLFVWNFQEKEYEDDFSVNPTTFTYVGGGRVALFPIPVIQTKDFNPYQEKGMQMKLSRINFLMDTNDETPNGSITGASNANPCQITAPNHGLQAGQKITISQVQGMTQLNVGMFYTIVTVVDANNFTINVDSTKFGVYTSGGLWSLVIANASIQLFLNSSQSYSGNLLVGNKQLSSYPTAPFYNPGSDYQWHSFYATLAAQYMSILITYDDDLMNVLFTQSQPLTLNSLVIFARPGGKIVF